MNKILINGGYPLNGTIKISGSKNAALPMLISSLLADGESVFYNVPNLDDIVNTLSLLRCFGAIVEFKKNVVKINSSGLCSCEVPYDLVKKMRASVLVLGPLVARFGKAVIHFPGGCSIGARPIDLHLKAFQKLGVNVRIVDDCINVSNTKMNGSVIYFDFPTVTGTENLIMASVLANGETILKNAACEPEIVALSKGLNNMGAKIFGAGTSEIVIMGVKKLYSVNHFIIPDRIETGTFMIASMLTGGEINLIDCMPQCLGSLISKLRHVGANIDIIGDNIIMKSRKKMTGINFMTSPYPGFPTDMQPLFMVLLTLSCGISVISETIFENRFAHVKELNRMGAKIVIIGSIAVVNGVKRLYGTKVRAMDLRGSASLILAGLAAKGETEIKGINYLDRGYEDLEIKFRSLGGRIIRV